MIRLLCIVLRAFLGHPNAAGSMRVPGSAGVRWLLRPARPQALAAFRIATHAWVLYYLGRRWRLIGRVASGRRRDFRPVGVARGLRSPLPVGVVRATTALTYATTVCAGLGIAHRVTAPLNAALVWWTLTYRNSWSMIFHNDNLLVLHVAVLGLAPAADAWSVDAAVARRRGLPAAEPSWQYGWPLQLANAITTSTYLLAGVAKVAGPLGLGWASGEHLRSQVAVDHVRKAVLRPASTSGQAEILAVLERHRWLWPLFATSSLALELGAPLALVHPTLGRLWALGAWGMHVGIRAIMGITFRHQLSGVPYIPLVVPSR